MKSAASLHLESREPRGPVRRSNGAALPSVAVREAMRSPGEALEAGALGFMEAAFGRDFSDVRVHADGPAAEAASALGAQAYTIGPDIFFGSGAYRPIASEGRHLIAHELAHVVQQAGTGPAVQRRAAAPLVVGQNDDAPERKADAVAARVMSACGTSAVIDSAALARSSAGVPGIQCRRLPPGAAVSGSLPAAPTALSNTRPGFARMLSRSWNELDATDQASVLTAAAPLTWTDAASMRLALTAASRTRLIAVANAIRTARPDLTLGDPALIDVGPRPATTDAANLATLIANADTIFTAIAGPAQDANLTDIFGAPHIAAARTKYANAQAAMTSLAASGHIVTDRSGYSDEVELGGLSNSRQIALHFTMIDNPAADESVVTLIHESMHAGNADVDDFGYITQPSFTALSAAVKLTNAAHFEVVPRRILGAAHGFPGVVFIPAGTSVGGVTAPTLTRREQAIRDASEQFRSAWTAGLNLHTLFVRLFRAPTEWTTLNLASNFTGAGVGTRFSNTLPYWSKVEMLTVHLRQAQINPTGPSAQLPITQVDLALSEGLIRLLSRGMNSVPQTPADALIFETANATSAERTAAAASVAAERDLLIRLVLRVTLGSLTGTVGRDEKVVARLARAAAAPNFTDYLQIRFAASFP